MIDFKNKTIKGKSGKVYRIDPENISAGRWMAYQRLSLSISVSQSFQDVFNRIVAIRQAISSGNDILSAIDQVKHQSDEFIENVKKYGLNDAPSPIELCATFCNAEGEDAGVWNDEIIMSKYEDWKHIPIKDFFFLSAMATPGFIEEYQNLTGQSIEKVISEYHSK